MERNLAVSMQNQGVTARYILLKAPYQNLRDKRTAFLAETKARKASHTTVITAYGLRKNAYQAGIHFEVTLDDLFV